MSAACSVGGCDSRTDKGGHGLCGMHYARFKRDGHPGPADYLQRPDRTVEERVFLRLVEDSQNGCWLWTGATRNGYGVFGIGKSVLYVHRWVYEHLVAEIPSRLVLDHLCVNPRCSNPEHLEPVTRAVNNARGGRIHGTRARSGVLA